MNSMSPRPEELADFQAWKKANPNLTLGGYAYHNLGPDVAVAVASMFWPQLIEHEGGVFLAESFSKEAFDQWHAQLHGDMREIERMMNHVHLGDLIHAFTQLSTENQQFFANALFNCWRCRVRCAYPERLICVTIEGTGLDQVITLFRE
jgi:hypothetical protein